MPRPINLDDLDEVLGAMHANSEDDSDAAALMHAMLLVKRARAVLSLPTRDWDEDDADSPEARSARAYNSALGQVWALLQVERR